MILYEYVITLRIAHPSIDPLELTHQLGRTPRTSWQAGEPRRNPRGVELGGIRDSSYWTGELIEGINSEATLAVALARVAQDLGPHKDLFHRLRAEGGRVELFIGWFLEGNTGDELPAPLLSELGNLGLDLSFDVYPWRHPGAGTW